MRDFSHPSHLDEFGVLRPPQILVWILLFYCRGYLAWLVSLTYGQDRGFLLTLFYPRHQDWQLSLLVGLPALILAIAWMRRRPNAHKLVQWLWHRGMFLLVVAFILDSVILLLGLSANLVKFEWGLALGCAGNIWVGLFLFQSRRIKQAFCEYPK